VSHDASASAVSGPGRGKTKEQETARRLVQTLYGLLPCSAQGVRGRTPGLEEVLEEAVTHLRARRAAASATTAASGVLMVSSSRVAAPSPPPGGGAFSHPDRRALLGARSLFVLEVENRVSWTIREMGQVN
jgi:hypothetical protein